jgi:putative restriction endonuclease
VNKEQSIAKYVKSFQRLNTNKSRLVWDASTNYQAPHKPFLLLSMLDLLAEGSISDNLIELTPQLGELFAIYWSRVKPRGRTRGNIATPFFHLRSEGFWHLLPKPGHEHFLAQVKTIQAISTLQETIFGARLDDQLYELLLVEHSRDTLRKTLIAAYFAPEYQERLLLQGLVNIRAARYGDDLIERVQTQLKDAPSPEEQEPAVRDQGFRRAIVRAYDHRCAMCGVRILTADGHTAIVAAHIIPWSVSQNDDPRNGLALCHLCHWAFDEGLAAFSKKYRIQLSPQLAGGENVPGQLATLAGRGIIGPKHEFLRPFLESLQWHRRQVSRSR